LESRPSVTDGMEWQDMVTLDVTVTAFTVGLLEVKAASLASYDLSASPYGFKFPLAKPPRAFASHVKADGIERDNDI
jgi:hypothetical protein